MAPAVLPSLPGNPPPPTSHGHAHAAGPLLHRRATGVNGNNANDHDRLLASRDIAIDIADIRPKLHGISGSSGFNGGLGSGPGAHNSGVPGTRVGLGLGGSTAMLANAVAGASGFLRGGAAEDAGRGGQGASGAGGAVDGDGGLGAAAYYYYYDRLSRCAQIGVAVVGAFLLVGVVVWAFQGAVARRRRRIMMDAGMANGHAYWDDESPSHHGMATELAGFAPGRTYTTYTGTDTGTGASANGPWALDAKTSMGTRVLSLGSSALDALVRGASGGINNDDDENSSTHGPNANVSRRDWDRARLALWRYRKLDPVVEMEEGEVEEHAPSAEVGRYVDVVESEEEGDYEDEVRDERNVFGEADESMASSSLLGGFASWQGRGELRL